jgi:hypothetical protein
VRFDGAIDTYLKHLSSVKGWLHPFSARMIAAVSKYQVASGFRGSVAEIGVYHGKLFLVLYLTTDAGERALAIDVFAQQHLNIDKAGRGDKEIFLRHVGRWSREHDGLKIIEASSLGVTPQQILEQVGRVRLFSIDGSHTEETTTNDLRLAEAVATEEGVIIVDDCFNELWPEVSWALSKYLRESPAFVPFVVTRNKILLCRPAYRERYATELAHVFPKNLDKSARMYGFPIAVMGVLPDRFRRVLRRTAIGDFLRRLVY